MKVATLEKLRKYIGTKIKVTYRAVRNLYEYEGIMQNFNQGNLILKEHEGKPFGHGRWGFGERWFSPNHIVKVITEDGKEWY